MVLSRSLVIGAPTAIFRSLRAVLLIAGLAVLAAPMARAADVYGRVYDTMRGELYPGARVELGTRAVVADDNAQYWLRDVAPGAYLIRVVIPGRREVNGRVLVVARQPTNIVNLDLGRIDPPHDEDEY